MTEERVGDYIWLEAKLNISSTDLLAIRNW